MPTALLLASRCPQASAVGGLRYNLQHFSLPTDAHRRQPREAHAINLQHFSLPG